MQSENRFFDDIVKMMNGAAGTLAGIGREAESSARERAREWIGGLDLVGRDEFEAMKMIAVAARDEVELLKARIAKLEGSDEHVPTAYDTPAGDGSSPLTPAPDVPPPPIPT